MNILVCSKISIPAKDRTLPAWNLYRQLGHGVWVEHPGSEFVDQHLAAAGAVKPDAIISMGVSIMEETFEALKRFPGVPLFCYNWDCYAWVWEPGQGGKVQAKNPSRPNEYNYLRYGELLRRAREVWVPSNCTGLRTEEWWPWTKDRWHRVLSAAPWFDLPCPVCKGDQSRDIYDDTHGCLECGSTGIAVKDGGFAFCPLRDIPDPCWDWFERACTELKIPYKMRQGNRADYELAVCKCRFLVSHCYELSTGGLTLLEGYRLGKPVLISDSPWHGGRDYFGDRAVYFHHDSYEDFKISLESMHENVPKLPLSRLSLSQQAQWVEDNFSDLRMARDMLRRIEDA